MKILDRGASFARRLSVFYLFTIVGVLFFGFFYYKYIPENQSELDGRAFRILNQLSANMVRRNDEIAATFKNFDNVNFGSKEDLQLRHQLSRNLNYFLACSVTGDTDKDFSKKFGADSDLVFHYPFFKCYSVVRINDFIEPVLEARDDVFSSYILMKKPEGNDSTHGRKIGGMMVLYKTKNLSATTIFNTDSAWSLQKNSDLATVTDLSVSGAPYKLFSRPFFMHGQQMVLAGVISRSDYDRKIKALPVRFISTLLISILIGIIFLPFVKVFMLSPKENMTRMDVLGTTLSVYAGSAILVLIGFYLVIYFLTVSTFTQRVKTIAGTITAETEKEITAASRQIDSYTKLYSSLRPEEKQVLYYQQKDSNIIHQVDRKMIPSGFKNIYRVFWIDSRGNTLAKWNSYDFNAPLTNTSSYDYFKQLSDKTPGDSSLVVYPGKSNITNEFQVFFMKRSAASVTTVNDQKIPCMAVGIAGFLDLAIRPVIPAGFGFCVVDNRNGDILIHSDYRRSLSENILTETGENDRLFNCLQNRTSARLEDVNLYGLPHLMYVNPIRGQNLSLVTFYRSDVFSVNIFRMVHFTMETILYVLIALVLCVFFSTRYKSGPPKLEFKLDPVEWVRPCEKNILSYIFTDRFYRALLIFFIGVSILIFLTGADVRSIYYISILTPFYAMWGFLASRRKESLAGYGNKSFLFFQLFSLSKTTFFFIALINWIFFSMIANENYGHPLSVCLYVIFFQVGALLILFLCFHWVFKKTPKDTEDKAKLNFADFYTRSLYLSVLLMSILPVSGVILYALNAEKIQYCKMDAYAVANADQVRQQYRISTLMPGYKPIVRSNFDLVKYFPELRDSVRYSMDGEILTHGDSACSQSAFYDEPYITLLDDLFLITSGEYNSYSLHAGAVDKSWTFSAPDDDHICLTKYMTGDKDHPNESTDSIYKNIRVRSAYASMLYGFSNVDRILPLILIVFGLIFLWFGRRFFLMLVTRIFLLNFIPEGYPLKKNNGYLKKFMPADENPDPDINEDHPDTALSEIQELQILERSIACSRSYQKIWNDLDPMERYLLYDFCLDGYTNYRDAATLVKLLEKQILNYHNNELTLFNLAFRNFILTKKGSPEVEKLKQEYSVPGIWQTIRIPALVIIAVAALFLLLTQENVSHKLAGLITSVGALIPLALEISKRAASKSS